MKQCQLTKVWNKTIYFCSFQSSEDKSEPIDSVGGALLQDLGEEYGVAIEKEHPNDVVDEHAVEEECNIGVDEENDSLESPVWSESGMESLDFPLSSR
jgi:hypothetical protein